MSESFPAALPYKTFQTRNPDWEGPYWKRCRALYAGQRKLLQSDRKLMKEVFPPHRGEPPDVYEERVARSLYICYPGQIIDFICSALSSDPIHVDSKPEPDPWYVDFMTDVSKPGGRRIDLDQFARMQVLTALQCKRAWTLVDLPEFAGEEAPESLGDQQEAGLLDAYLCAIDPENVIDWEEDKDGQLAFAIVYNCSRLRGGLTGDRKQIVEEYTYYTRDQWARYEIAYPEDKPPTDESIVSMKASGQHSFGQVPLVPFELTDGLWAMGKLEQLAVEHFNKRSALSWGQYRSLFQFLVANLGPMDPLTPQTDDPNRAQNQVIGAGRVMELGPNDKIGYVGPDSAPFKVAMEDLSHLRDEMHRVLHSMAMSVDNSGAALKRSGQSKSLDQAVTTVVLKALGALVREHVHDVLQLVADGRGDNEKYDFVVTGMSEFDNMSLDSLLEEAATLNEIGIKSETFNREYQYRLAKTALGSAADPEKLKKIQSELDANITPESIAGPTSFMGGDPFASGADPFGDRGAQEVAPVKAAKSAAKPKSPKAKPAKAAA